MRKGHGESENINYNINQDCGTCKYSAEMTMCIKHSTLIQTNDFDYYDNSTLIISPYYYAHFTIVYNRQRVVAKTPHPPS